jgi:acetyl esterase
MIDVDLANVVDLRAQQPPLREEGIIDRRERERAESAVADGPAGTACQDIQIGVEGQIARQFMPMLANDSPPSDVTYLFVHGGGGVMGSVASYDAMIRHICSETNAATFAFDYRLAPEAPLTAAIEDTKRTYMDIRNAAPSLGLSPTKIVLIGDSMGALIAANATRQLAAERAPIPAAICLLYPNTDLTLALSQAAPPMRDVLPHMKDDLKFIVSQLGLDQNVKAFSPLFAEDTSAMPPTFVATAQYDILCAEGRQYAEKSVAAGVSTFYVDVPEMVHGFMRMTRASGGAMTATKSVCRLLGCFCDAIIKEPE